MFDQFENKKDALLQKLSETTIEESIEGVSVTVSCLREIKNINISDTLIKDGDRDRIEDLLITTLNRALKSAEAEEMNGMQKMISESLPPGLNGMEGLSDFLA